MAYNTNENENVPSSNAALLEMGMFGAASGTAHWKFPQLGGGWSGKGTRDVYGQMLRWRRGGPGSLMKRATGQRAFTTAAEYGTARSAYREAGRIFGARNAMFRRGAWGIAAKKGVTREFARMAASTIGRAVLTGLEIS